MFEQPSVSHPREHNSNFLGTTLSVPQVSYTGEVSRQPECPLTPFTTASDKSCLLRNPYKCQISYLCNYKYIFCDQVVMTSDITAVASLLHPPISHRLKQTQELWCLNYNMALEVRDNLLYMP